MIEDVSKRDLGQYGGMMPKVSIALIVFAVLVLLFLRLLKSGRPALPLLLLTGTAAVQALLVSLRWDYGVIALRPVQVLITCLLPPIAWFGFRGFAVKPDFKSLWRVSVHLLPALFCMVSLAIFPDVIDFIIIATFLIYGVATLRTALGGEAALPRTPLNGVVDVQRALWLITFMLFGSVLVDLLVFLDFARAQGEHAPLLVGFGNLAVLIAIGLSVAFGSKSIAETDSEEDDTQIPPDETDGQVVDTAIRLLRDDGLAKDPNLTLNRLARRMGLPARTISRAVNRVKKRNVSQFVNDVRVDEACRLLMQTDMSVTTVIYESGFQTKSNFNREFLRVTGKTPSAWRQENSDGQRPASTASASSANVV